jgi:four helix bundle suffix protein
MAEGFMPPHGGYKKLMSFQKTEIIYDATFHFCQRFYKNDRRTTDQMVQAARSGKQNIVEGSMASGTSKETEIKLTNVARSSLEELLNDYCDFLRVRELPIWDKNNANALAIRKLGYGPNTSYETYRSYIEQGTPDVAANTMVCLINQTNFLLDQQKRRMQKDFLQNGGIRERMHKARTEYRNKTDGSF